MSQINSRYVVVSHLEEVNSNQPSLEAIDSRWRNPPKTLFEQLEQFCYSKTVPNYLGFFIFNFSCVPSFYFFGIKTIQIEKLSFSVFEKFFTQFCLPCRNGRLDLRSILDFADFWIAGFSLRLISGFFTRVLSNPSNINTPAH